MDIIRPCSWWRPWTSPTNTCWPWGRASTTAPTPTWCASKTMTGTTRRRPSASITSLAKVLTQKHSLYPSLRLVSMSGLLSREILLTVSLSVCLKVNWSRWVVDSWSWTYYSFLFLNISYSNWSLLLCVQWCFESLVGLLGQDQHCGRWELWRQTTCWL